jgi:hypothetical protein
MRTLMFPKVRIGSLTAALLAAMCLLAASQPCAAGFALHVTAAPTSISVPEGQSGVFTFTVKNISTGTGNLNLVIDSVTIGQPYYLNPAQPKDEAYGAALVNNKTTPGTVLAVGKTSTFQLSFKTRDLFPDSDKDRGNWMIPIDVTAHAQANPTMHASAARAGHVIVTDTVLSNPEPASLTMVGIGALCLAGYAWRRRQAKA